LVLGVRGEEGAAAGRRKAESGKLKAEMTAGRRAVRLPGKMVSENHFVQNKLPQFVFIAVVGLVAAHSSALNPASCRAWPGSL